MDKCRYCGEPGATEEVNASYWHKRGTKHMYHKRCLALLDLVW